MHERLLHIDGPTADEAVFCDREGTPLAKTSARIVKAVSADVVAAGSTGVATIATTLTIASTPSAATFEASATSVAAVNSAAVLAAASVAPARVAFDDLSSVVDAAWFTSHAHLFRWSERRGEMVFEAGAAAPPNVPSKSDSTGAESMDHDHADHADHADYPGRPGRLADLVGQADVKSLLLPAIAAAELSGRPLDHTLFFGPPGTGKSTVARLVAAALGTRAKTVNGATLAEPGVLIRLLASLRSRDVLFLDEVHAAPRRLLESLYEAMEERRVSFAVGDGRRSRTMSVKLEPFTLIGATTEAGVLAEAFESRFGLRASFAPYSTEELSVIVECAIAHQQVEIDPAAAHLIAEAARGSAREAHALTRRAVDAATLHSAPERPSRIDVDAANAALRALTIDSDGLRAVERRALAALRSNGSCRPMGMARWAAASGLPVATLRHICEPALLRGGFIDVGPRGRFATRIRLLGGGTE